MTHWKLILGIVWLTLLAASGVGMLTEAMIVVAALTAFIFAIALWSQIAEECVLGADGIRTPRDFFPWESIAKIELNENQLVIHAHDGFRGYVSPNLPGKVHQEALQRLKDLERGKLRARPPELSGTYRERRAYPPQVLVRIALDPTLEDDRRIAAFRELEEEHRAEVLDEMADEHFQKLLQLAVD